MLEVGFNLLQAQLMILICSLFPIVWARAFLRFDVVYGIRNYIEFRLAAIAINFGLISAFYPNENGIVDVVLIALGGIFALLCFIAAWRAHKQGLYSQKKQTEVTNQD